jgi:Uncharacterized protein conserved in bacteria
MDPFDIPQREKTWAMFAHLSSFLGWIGIPLANIIAPLVMWQLRLDDMPFGSSQAKECLNFQISVTLYTIISVALCFALIGIPLLLLVLIGDIVFTVTAAIRANKGEAYRYPYTIRFVK